MIVCFGELLIDFVALERGVTVGQATHFEKVAGGAPANVAVGLAKLGLAVAFMTQLGNDPFGHFLIQTLVEHGVDTSGVVFTDAARTALAFASIAADGERSFAFYRHPSADMLMPKAALNQRLLQQASLFHFGSITLIDQPVRDTTLAASASAKANGALISYDPNLRKALWPDEATAREQILLGLQQANIVKMNEEELTFLTGAEPTAESARTLWHTDLHLMVITRGAAGCLALTPSTTLSASGFSVQIEDTIGAGDGFMAGLLAGIIQSGQNWRDFLPTILHQANAVGALTASKRGAIPALPTAGDLQQFLQIHSFSNC